MKKIEIDIETYSGADLNKCGVYKYAESPDFEVLLFGYSVDGEEVQVIDLTQGEKIPDDIIKVLTDETVEKWAHNVQFERVCLSRFLRDMGLLCEGEYLSPRGWYCSMIWSAYLGLPFSLAAVGAALGLEEQKMTEGKNLIRFFCVPCKPTKVNNQRTRNRSEDDAEKWDIFKKYNKRDVEVEMQICRKLEKFPVPYPIWNEFWLDQEINDRGILVDRVLVESAINLDEWSQERLKAALQELTNLDNPNSVAQMKEWLKANGMEMNSLGKKDVAEAVKTAPEPLRTVLLLRQQSAKSAVKKYVAMDNAVCSDGRLRGMFQFYGANRSGRFSGRIVQLQNLYRNSLEDLDEARELVRQNNKGALEVLYDSVPEVLAELVRTAFIPQPGKKFIVADFSAIEARVLSYMAGEQWRLDVFHNGGDIYCATAEKMYGVRVVKHGENGELRQKGKQAELACGYGGGVGALKAMGALDAGIAEEELDGIVKAWRNASPKIVKMWWDVDREITKAIKERTTTHTHNLTFSYQSGFLFITLPSGRKLAYVKPRIGENKFGGESVTYMGVNKGKWERIESYGPKFVENCIAEGVEVLTNRGLVEIQNIRDEDKVWDGVEWVQHEGLIDQGDRNVVMVDGLFMTANHKILTREGWIECVKAEGLNWADVSLPYGFGKSREYETGESTMAVQVCMWKYEGNSGKNIDCQEVSDEIMWMHDEETDIRSEFNTSDEPSSCLGSMAFHEAEVQRSESPSVSQLRGQGDHSVRTMDGEFRGFLGRHEYDLPEGNGTGSDRQRQRIQPRKLSMGNKKGECQKQENQQDNRDTLWEDDGSCSIRIDRDRGNNYPLSIGSQLANGISVRETGFKKRVYDIRNCGPRHRFCVYDRAAGKLRIVSNCIQGISRDILVYAMETLRNKRIVAHVHDEIIMECDMDDRVEDICALMGRTPPWMEGLELRADGYECFHYKKD